MNYKELLQLVSDKAEDLRTEASFNGEMGDGGAGRLKELMNRCTRELVIKYDLRPSERWALMDKEVEVPGYLQEFIPREEVVVIRQRY